MQDVNDSMIYWEHKGLDFFQDSRFSGLVTYTLETRIFSTAFGVPSSEKYVASLVGGY